MVGGGCGRLFIFRQMSIEKKLFPVKFAWLAYNTFFVTANDDSAQHSAYDTINIYENDSEMWAIDATIIYPRG